MRVLGVDPGLTRCGVGIVEGVGGEQADGKTDHGQSPSDGKRSKHAAFTSVSLDRHAMARMTRGSILLAGRLPALPVGGRGLAGPALESTGEGRGLGEPGEVDDLVDGLLRARQQTPRQALAARALLAAIDDETPGSDLAVIGNAHRKRQNRLDFTLLRAGLTHLKCGHGTANCEIIEQLQVFFHFLDTFIGLGGVGRS